MNEKEKNDILSKVKTIITIEDDKFIQKLYKMFFKDILGKDIISIYNERELDFFLAKFEDFEKISVVIVDAYLSEEKSIVHSLKAIKFFKEKSDALIIAASSDLELRKKLMKGGAHREVDHKNDLFYESFFLELVKSFQ